MLDLLDESDVLGKTCGAGFIEMFNIGAESAPNVLLLGKEDFVETLATNVVKARGHHPRRVLQIKQLQTLAALFLIHNI